MFYLFKRLLVKRFFAAISTACGGRSWRRECKIEGTNIQQDARRQEKKILK